MISYQGKSNPHMRQEINLKIFLNMIFFSKKASR